MRYSRLILLALIILSVVAFAVPQKMTYQGKLTSLEGIGVNATYPIRFRIYGTLTGGSAVWTETHSSVEIEKGLFSVTLGDYVPLDIDFSDQLFLEITVNGDVMSPRQEITSAGFALHAAVADSVAGITGAWTLSDFVYYTNEYMGLSRGDVSNALYGIYRNTHINFGVASVTGMPLENYQFATISGGFDNHAQNDGAVVAGGITNSATGYNSVVSGGGGNNANGDHSVISGGQHNETAGHLSTIPGGSFLIVGDRSFGFRGGINNDPHAPYDVTDEPNTFHLVETRFHFNRTNDELADFIIDGASDSLFWIDASEDLIGMSAGFSLSGPLYDSLGLPGLPGQFLSSTGTGVLWTDYAFDDDWEVVGDDMYTIPTGNVGIGITTPGWKLSVDGNIYVTGDVDSVDVSDFYDQYLGHVADNTNPHSVTAAQVGLDSVWNHDIRDSWTMYDAQYIGTDQIRARDTDGLLLSDTLDNGIFIEHGGEVGFGTLTPEADVHINGDLRVDGGIHDGTDFGAPGEALISDGSNVYWGIVAASGGNQINADTIRSEDGAVVDTVVVMAQTKIYGELIADSIQAVGAVLEIDDSTYIYGNTNISNNATVGADLLVNGAATVEELLTVNGNAIVDTNLTVNGNIFADSLFGLTGTIADTMWANGNFAINGELIVDSIQANGDTLFIDDHIMANGDVLINGKAYSDTTEVADLNRTLITKGYADARFDNDDLSDDSLGALGDVNLTGVTDDMTIVWNSVAGEWVVQENDDQNDSEVPLSDTTAFDIITGATTVFNALDQLDFVADSVYTHLAYLEGVVDTHLAYLEGVVDTHLAHDNDTLTNNELITAFNLVADSAIVRITEAGSDWAIDLSSLADTVRFDTLVGTVHDTIVAAGDFKVLGELIADSIQAVSDTIYLDDNTVTNGNTFANKAYSDTTLAVDTDNTLITKGYADSRFANDDITDDSIGSLTDVDLTGLANGDALIWDNLGGNWVPSAITGTDDQNDDEVSLVDTTVFEVITGTTDVHGALVVLDAHLDTSIAEIQLLQTDLATHLINDNDTLTNNELITAFNLVADSAIVRITEAGTDWAIDLSSLADTVRFDTLVGTAHDTIVAASDFKVLGELIADSIQAVGAMLYLDDEISINGKAYSDTTIAGDPDNTLITKGYVDSRFANDDLTDDNIGTLNDVDLTGLSNGDALVYDSVSGNWEASAITGTDDQNDNEVPLTSTGDFSIITGETEVHGALVDLDVAIGNLDDGDSLTTVVTWSDLSQIPAGFLDGTDDDDITDDVIGDLSNVDLTGLADGNILVYNGTSSNWEVGTSSASVPTTIEVDTITGSAHDTIVVMNDFKVSGELIVDSIQAVGTVLNIDDNTVLDGYIAKTNNTLYGTNVATHVNLGINSITGASGFDYAYATISGGQTNEASNEYTTVSGGISNIASGQYSTVGGGYDNTASGESSTISGGYQNQALGTRSSVIGGVSNVATRDFATVCGGNGNNAAGSYSGVISGQNNVAGSTLIPTSYSTVCGGLNNVVDGSYGVIVGGNDTKIGDGSFAFNGRLSTASIDLSAAANDNTFHIIDSKMRFNHNQNSEADIRFDGDSSYTFYMDADENRIGIRTNTPSSTHEINGSKGWDVSTVTTSSATLDENDNVVIVNYSTGASTINLPTAAGCTNRVYTIKNITAQTVTVDASGTETIDGALTVSLASQYDFVTIVSDGSNWFIIGTN